MALAPHLAPGAARADFLRSLGAYAGLAGPLFAREPGAAAGAALPSAGARAPRVGVRSALWPRVAGTYELIEESAGHACSERNSQTTGKEGGGWLWYGMV